MESSRSVLKRQRSRLSFEQLETRQLLSGYQPAAVEQLFLEQLNDIRANPAAYGASIGLDLSNVAPSQPLAFNPELIQAARLHSQDMSQRAYFSHNTPDGADPGRRMSDAGFVWRSWGESLAGGTAFPGPAEALQALIIDSGVPDLGHRHHLLAMDTLFQSQNQVGIGILQGASGPLVNYYTVDSAGTFGSQPFLTGVVFRDGIGNGKYDIGEGLGGVTITVSGLGSTTTFDSGGYSIAVNPGTYTVTASGGGVGQPITRTVTVDSNNYRLSLIAGNADDNTNGSETGYVRKLYQSILGRSATDPEVAGWMPALHSAAGANGVAAAIERSAEARTRLVKNWYVAYLGRNAVNGEEQVWVNALVRGTKEEDVQTAILGSDEFLNRAVTLNNAGSNGERYLQALYSLLLNRNGSSAEVTGWVGTLSAVGRSQVASAFLHSGEMRSDMVVSYYAALLHRSQAPTATEVASWVNTGLDCTTIRIGFEASPEFMLNG